jgi:hypothetical protein
MGYALFSMAPKNFYVDYLHPEKLLHFILLHDLQISSQLLGTHFLVLRQPMDLEPLDSFRPTL